MKIVKIEGYIKPCNTTVGDQPTIHVMLSGRIKITLDDGRVLEDNKLEWDDSPRFKHSSLTVDELIIINDQLESHLLDAAEFLALKIQHVSEYINVEVKDDDVT